MSSNNQSENETVDLFNLESNKLENVINHLLQNSEDLSISKIIEVYYQVINIKSLTNFLRKDFEGKNSTEESKLLFIRMREMENYIFKKFDVNLHPLIMSKLKNLIENTMGKLKDTTSKHKEKTKNDLEVQAKMYEKLRQIMSTKEFVDQYHKGLNNSTKKQ